MKKCLWLAAGIVSLMILVSTSAFADSTKTVPFDVIISIVASADVSVQGGPVNFGTGGVGYSAVTSTPITITNTGSGSNQTYSLKLTNPEGWTAVTTSSNMEINQYQLSAAFSSAVDKITWAQAHALTKDLVSASATQFAGDQTGKAVPYGESRKLWLKIVAPSKTSSPGSKTIPVTLVAVVD